MAGDRLLSDDLPAPAELLDNLLGATVRKTAGTGPAAGVLALPLRNDGTVESLSGVLKVEDGGATPDSGTFRGASRANRVLLGAGRTLYGDATLEGTVEIGSLVGPISVVPGETLAGPAELARTGGDFAGNLRVTGTMSWSGGRRRTGDHRRAGAEGCASTASPRRRAPQCSSPTGTASATRASCASSRAPTSSRPPRSARGSTTPPRSSSTAAPRTRAAPRRASSATRSSPMRGRSRRSPARARRSSGAGSTTTAPSPRARASWSSTATPRRCSRGRSRAPGRARRSGSARARFALGPAAAITGRTVEDFAELAIPAGTTLPVPAEYWLELTGTLSGAGKLRVAGALELRALVKQTGPGTTQIAPGGTLAVPAGAIATLTGDRALVNQGAATVTGRVAVGQGSAILNEGSLTLAGTGKLERPGVYGSGGSGLVHNAGTLTKAGAGEGEVAVALDNDGTIAVEAGTLAARGLVNWGVGNAAGPAGGSLDVAGTLVVPAPLTANAARLVLDGAASAVVYPDTATAGTPRRDALAGLARNAAGGELVLRGGRSLTVGGAFANEGVLDLGAGSTLAATGVQPVRGRDPQAGGHGGRSRRSPRSGRRDPRRPARDARAGDRRR